MRFGNPAFRLRVDSSAGFTMGKGGNWKPTDLGASHLEAWDAERPDLISLSGAFVTSWVSIKNGYGAVQGGTNARPTFNASGFNGRAVVAGDGVDDELTFTGAGVFPTGAGAVEIWALVDQVALPDDTTARFITGYGSGNAAARRVGRYVNASVNRAHALIGDGFATLITVPNPSINLSGRHVIRTVIGPATTRVDVDGVAGPVTAAVPNTTAARLRLFAGAAGSAAGFWSGGLNRIDFTAPLTDSEAAKMLAFYKARGGIA